MEEFLIKHSIDVIGIGGTFLVICILLLLYLVYKLGTKKVPVSHYTEKIQCQKYVDEMEKKNILYQWLKITYADQKPINTNCIYWNKSKKCELSNEKCKFF